MKKFLLAALMTTAFGLQGGIVIDRLTTLEKQLATACGGECSQDALEFIGEFVKNGLAAKNAADTPAVGFKERFASAAYAVKSFLVSRTGIATISAATVTAITYALYDAGYLNDLFEGFVSADPEALEEAVEDFKAAEADDAEEVVA